jgi:hypothetical protein
MHSAKVCYNGCDSPPYSLWRYSKFFFSNVFFELNDFSVVSKSREDSIVLDRMSPYNLFRAIAIDCKTSFSSRLSAYLLNELLNSYSCIAHGVIDAFLGADTSGAALKYGFIASPA